MRGRGSGYVQNAQRRLATARARMRGAGGLGGRGRGRSPMPWDSQAQRESAGLGAEAADTRAALGASFAAAQSDLGFGTGASNPYSQVAENAKQLAVNQRGIGTTAGNNLYAGSTLNAQSQARGEYDKTQKGIEGAIAGAQTDYNSGLARTARDEQLGMAGIKEGAIERRAASTPPPLAVGRGRGRGAGGIGAREGRGVRRPQAARQLNARARAINARLTSPSARGRLY